jgi:NAD(P)-dependent dehydrogenase (short-subunit alcohol dehydrogenase family)
VTGQQQAARGRVGLVTGASRGFGRALSRALGDAGWTVVVDARDGAELARAMEPVGPAAVQVPGDVADPAHRVALAGEVHRLGRLDLLVNNASRLGPSPQPRLVDYPLAELARVYEVDVLAPLALFQVLHRWLARSRGTVVNVTSDAAVEAYPGWGGYGSAKAAFDQVSAVLAVECPDLAVYAFDPGDMRTDMHQQAFPGEDISDRPPPETVVPALTRLLDERPPSGRYRAADLALPAVSS